MAPSSEWRWHFYNYKFWIGDHHFLTSFQPTSLHCYFTFLLINDVRMTTFTHQLLSRITSTPEVWQCEREHSSRSATCPSLCLLHVGYAEVIFVQPGGKLDTMWRDAWQRLASSYPTSRWDVSVTNGLLQQDGAPSHTARNTETCSVIITFSSLTEPNILSIEQPGFGSTLLKCAGE